MAKLIETVIVDGKLTRVQPQLDPPPTLPWLSMFLRLVREAA